MNTLKPLFIFAALGLALVVVYTALSRSPDSDHEPPHVEGLAVPSTDAPLVQMPGDSSTESPFGVSMGSAPPSEVWASSPHSVPGSSVPLAGAGAPPSALPGTSVYGGSPPSSLAGTGNPELPPGYDSPAPAFSGSEPARDTSQAEDAECVSGCPIPTAPLGTDGRSAERADAPTWPSSQAVAGIVPPHDSASEDRASEAPSTIGPGALPNQPDLASHREPSENEAEQAFHQIMDQVSRELDAGRLAEAHMALSRCYRSPGLAPEQARPVRDLLDQLAGTVIYSRQNLLEPPYMVRPGDTLQTIAEQFDVPPELIANINGIRDPRGVQPGQELKVVRGPFHAVVHLNDYELTMMLGNLYAGRFPITIGRDQPNLEGTYVVTDKGVGPTYYGPDGTTLVEHDPRNPLGSLWLGLGDPNGRSAGIGIHGTNDPRTIGRDAPRGNIGLEQRDIQDVFGILSVGSRVVIQR